MLLNEKFLFSRPLTVTGVIFYKNKSEPDFHQMTLDRIEKNKYVLANTQFSDNSSTASDKKWWKLFGLKLNSPGMLLLFINLQQLVYSLREKSNKKHQSSKN